MRLFDIIKRKSKESFAISNIIQQMFVEAGISPQCPDKNVFLTVIDGVHCSFRTILKCDEENPNKLFIYARASFGKSRRFHTQLDKRPVIP